MPCALIVRLPLEVVEKNPCQRKGPKSIGFINITEHLPLATRITHFTCLEFKQAISCIFFHKLFKSQDVIIYRKCSIPLTSRPSSLQKNSEYGSDYLFLKVSKLSSPVNTVPLWGATILAGTAGATRQMVCSSSWTRLNPYCLWSQFFHPSAIFFFVSNLPLESSYVPNTVRFHSVLESPISTASKVKMYNP